MDSVASRSRTPLKLRTITISILLLCSCSRAATEPLPPALTLTPEEKGTQFVGEVRHGETFEREFGGGLKFVLAAERDALTPGWFIEVRAADKNLEGDLSEVVTIPLRGFNPKYLSLSYGNTAADVVAFKVREFSFLKNSSDLPAEAAIRRILLWPPSTEEWEKALESMGKSPQCKGALRILDHRLVTPPGGTSERIDWLRFEVELCRQGEEK
jgi:hypothetical protein